MQHFLSLLGQMMLFSFWQMAIVFAIYKIVTSFAILSPSARFRFSVSLIVLSTFLFFIQILLPVFGEELMLPKAVTSVTASDSFALYTGWFPVFLGTGYIIGFLYLIINHIYACNHLRELKTQPTKKPPVDWAIFLNKHAQWLGISQKVTLRISQLPNPATYGFLKPVILLPFSCLTQLNPVQIEALLLHELMHIKRFDYLFAILLRLTESVLFFNPFAKALIKEARQAAEEACDEMVLQFGYNALDYSGALVSVAKNNIRNKLILQASGGQQGLLYKRISKMLTGESKPNAKNALSGILVLLSALALPVVFQKGASLMTENSNQSLLAVSNPETISVEQNNVTDFESAILDARKKLIAVQIGTLPQSKKPISKEKTIDQNLVVLEKVNPEENETVPVRLNVINPVGELVINANWLNKQQATHQPGAFYDGWNHLNSLISQLDSQGNLAENEWKELILLVSYYTEIKQAIQEEVLNAEKSNVFIPAVEDIAQTENRVLVIAYDESTGILAASYMNHSELPEFKNQIASSDEQEVILLRKPKVSGKKVIRL